MAADAARVAARARVAALVRNFARNSQDYLRANYLETPARTEFITPFLEAFGWDVQNAAGRSLALREVVEEASVDVAEERMSKRPDYELRLARQRKLFVEAKKPAVHIERDRSAAFQVRRYGYSASLPICVLTNFHHLAVYDCRPVPSEADEAHVARLLLIRYDEFEARFDELWELFSRESIYSGRFDARFAVDVTRRGAQQFDDLFLAQVKSWRSRLARDIFANTAGLSSAELTYAVQLFLSRIIFLRICEDREIERYETLRQLPAANTFGAFLAELRRADAFYNSGLFRLLDDADLNIRISDEVLHSIIEELYYPQSPYTFSVVETEVLGEIYEHFLGDVITVGPRGIRIETKPEVRESGGVVPTPRFVADAIVERALRSAIDGKSPAELSRFTVADVCCGSGIFLLSVYERLLDHHLSWYLEHNRAEHVGIRIYEAGAGQWRLSFEEKRRILLAHIRGVDIDSNAVEVARFSLLLKLIEHETLAGLREFVERERVPALPSLNDLLKSGNSLVSQQEWSDVLGAMPRPLVESISPFNWAREFPEEFRRGGFDVVVANPPYIRIQKMILYAPEEARYFQHEESPYSTAREGNFDKYALFIERAISLVSASGRVGVIVPHKFMTTQAGAPLRRLLSTGGILEGVVNFGIKQVFGRDVSNYTCILVLDKAGGDSIQLEEVRQLEAWRYGAPGVFSNLPSDRLGGDNWEFADGQTSALFARIRADHAERLGSVAEIFVGVQTSADPIFIFPQSESDRARTVALEWNDRTWRIERGAVRPCLLDVPLDPYARPRANSWMIYPYRIATVNGQEKAILLTPREMTDRFPICFEYLRARRAELGRRNITGGRAGEQQFYQFGRSQSLTKFDAPKIILPILSREARYGFDDSNIVVTGGGNGPYYMIRSRRDAVLSNHYLLAVLNHPMSEAFVRKNTSTFRGGYYSHGKQFIEDLPIPMGTPELRRAVETLVIELIDVTALLEASRTPPERERRTRQIVDLRAEIERFVSNAFGLSAADMTVVQAVPVPG